MTPAPRSYHRLHFYQRPKRLNTIFTMIPARGLAAPHAGWGLHYEWIRSL